MLKKFKPLHGYVLIKFVEFKNHVEHNGIIIPNTIMVELSRWRVAEVMALGDGIPTKNGGLVPHQLKVGDKILIDRVFGNVVTNDKHLVEAAYRVVSHDQIEGVLEGDDLPEFFGY